MIWRPFDTLTGRMVLVTAAAVVLAYAAAYALFARERGTALRHAAEIAVIERVAFTAERLRGAPPQQRPLITEAIRDFSIRYDLADAPSVPRSENSAGARIGREIADRLGGADVRAQTRAIVGRMHAWGAEMHRRHMRENAGQPPLAADLPADRAARMTLVTVSVALGDGLWLNARARLPSPRPAPLSMLAGALVAVFAVGVGAALVSRQIGRPLADLTRAASAFGAGQIAVTAPVSGPEDVRKASTAFNAMAERLGRQLNRQRQMLWALSHDLRTPITALKLRAELIEDEAARQRLLAPIEEMARLTEQALALARAGASDEPRARVDVAEIARTLCGELQDIGMDIRAEANAPVFVECRPSEIARAMRNLAENASRYAGSGTMHVSSAGTGEAVMEVRDEGPGVPKEMLAKLAEPFFRADSARSQSDGAGLGLAIAQAIAEAHGGRLEFANLVPRGFSARLILPGG